MYPACMYPLWVSEWVSEWVLNANLAIFQLYQVEYKLIFNEKMMTIALS